MKTLAPSYVAEHLAWHMADKGIETSNGPALEDIVKVQADRVKTLKEMAEISAYFYQDFTEFDATALKKHLRPVAQQPLEVVKEN